jgi:alpha-glucosidase
MYSKFSASQFKAEVEAWERAIGDRAWPAYFLSNHDIKRHISRYAKGQWTEDRARVAAAMLLTLRGTPFLYQGEEIGMQEVWFRKGEVLDPVGRKYWPFHPGRDGARTPMQWTAAKNAGFSDAEPWLCVHRDYQTLNVAYQEKAPDSLLNFYKKLLWLRKANPALHAGTYRPCDGVPEGVFSYIREGETQRILVALNFTSKSMRFTIKPSGGNKEARLLLSHPGRDGASIRIDSVELGPYGILLAEM